MYFNISSKSIIHEDIGIFHLAVVIYRLVFYFTFATRMVVIMKQNETFVKFHLIPNWCIFSFKSKKCCQTRFLFLSSGFRKTGVTASKLFMFAYLINSSIILDLPVFNFGHWSANSDL